ncbi:MAG TPA: polysaccharide deacetylase [Candidatus Blautia faecigallinarum]|uniref:Polysaccharide deacetylase n=1 Tax=Candidatus Blautia faecigallinarum TaxID=2838488 RepID=A0A9D2ISP0_9FIRM|nr:polysaccharide deacetylase [Candidatus Blautia faecigallinarum]
MRRRRAARLERIRRRRKRAIRNRIILGCSVLCFLAVIVGVSSWLIGRKKGGESDRGEITDMQQANAGGGNQAEGSGSADRKEGDGNSGTEGTAGEETPLSVLDQARLLAAQYDYDKAIELLKNDAGYGKNQDMQAAVQKFEETKASCKLWPAEEVTHVFYHSLVVDTSKAFDGDAAADGYNQVMTTIDEFNKITQSMYDKGYVMVSLYDMATASEDGTMTRGEILLPPGKIPFVLSQDDVSYYHYMEKDGFASKLVVDENGKVRNEYVEDDGSISIGDYDMVPLIDRFVEEHPDFSYRGAKGTIALTGYNGILGYRTDISYETRPDDLNEDKVKWLDEHPEFNLEEERAGAKKVADAMKANGWTFASHTWGHLNVAEVSLDRLQADTQRFKENVDPLIGGTDIIIFAFGADLSSVGDYSGEKFEYYKGQGYNYFCNVDSSQYFVQFRDRYLRQGRRNLDGYRMYYNPELLTDLFDASAVFDPARPTPVPPM